MKTFLTLVTLALIAYGGYRLYEAHKEQASFILEQARSKPGADFTGTYVSGTTIIDIDQVDGITLELAGPIPGKAVLRGNQAIYVKGSCQVVMTFNRDTMTAKDNGYCAGFDTRSADTFRRQ